MNTRDLALLILDEYYPNYKKECSLPPEIILICIQYNCSIKNVYHDNGNLYKQKTYFDNINHGVFTTWYRNNVVQVSRSWRYGKKHGTCTKYYDNGTKASRDVWVNDKIISYETWANNGVLVFKRDEDSERMWTKNGRLRIERCLHNGKPHGSTKEWYINNSHDIYSIGFYLYGKKHGEHKTYYMNGNLRSVQNWNNGDRHGLFQAWYSNGDVQYYQMWNKNKLIDPL